MAGMLGIGSAAFGVIAIPILAAAAAGALTNDPPRAGVARLFAARYSILSALLLFAMPIAFATNLRPLLGNALVLESRPELAAVTFAAVTAAWVVVATGYVSLCLAHERMPGIPERPRERLGIADGIFSTPGGRLGMLAGASAPTVLLTAASSIRGVPVFSSMLHGASGGMSTWQALTGIAAGIALGLILLYFNSLLFTVIEPKAGRSFRMFSDVFTIFRPLTESKHAPRRIWQPLGRVDEYLKRMLRSGANQLLHGGELETGSSSLAEIGAGAWFQDQTAPRASGARGALQGARAWLKLKWNKLVTGLGAGYSDPARPGRLYPEHSFLAVQLLSLFAFYIIAGFALVPAGGGIRWPVPTLAFIALLLMILVYAITAAAFWFDRWRVPPSIVALLWIVAISWLSGLDHRFPTAARAACADAPCEALTPGDAADSWLAARRADGDACAPLIAVAVSGGGIRAAAWSTHVLTALEERYGDRFTERLHVISSVSGGSVGVVHYLSDFIERTSEGPIKDRSKRIGALQDVRDAASHESLRATAYGFVYPDFGRLVLPFALRARDGTLEEGETPVVPDRAVLMESVWRSQLPTNRRGDMLGDWREGIAAGARPVALINATSVETGRPFVMTSVDLDPNESESVASAATAGAFRDIPSFYKLYPKRDIHPMTAARMSATFPWVAPVARPELGEPEASDERAGHLADVHHLADGGYFDNFGRATLARYLRLVGGRLRPQARAHGCGRRQVMLITIRDSTSGGAELSEAELAPPRWRYAYTGPIETILNAREAAQASGNDLVLELLQDSFETDAALGLELQAIEFALPNEHADEIALSWRLTPNEQERLRRSICSIEAEADCDESPLARLDNLLSDATSAPHRLLRCRDHAVGE